MTRITVPEAHIALLLPVVLADELRSFCRSRRLSLLRSASRAQSPEMRDELKAEASVLGDVLLAFIDSVE